MLELQLVRMEPEEARGADGRRGFVAAQFPHDGLPSLSLVWSSGSGARLATNASAQRLVAVSMPRPQAVHALPTGRRLANSSHIVASTAQKRLRQRMQSTG